MDIIHHAHAKLTILILVNAMTTTTKASKKTSIAGTQKSHRLSPKSNRRTTKPRNRGVKELKCDNTNFGVQLKERSHWSYSDATVRKEHELKAEQKIEQDTGVATKDVTVYASVFITR